MSDEEVSSAEEKTTEAPSTDDVSKVGTNDSKEKNWDRDAYEQDLKELVDVYRDLKTKPSVYLMIPPRVLDTDLCREMTIKRDIILNEVPKVVKQVAKSENIHLIDLSDIFVDETFRHASMRTKNKSIFVCIRRYVPSHIRLSANLKCAFDLKKAWR